ncbi:adenylate kinase [Serinicoccus sp. LYQ131]|uniref:adenylate kinase n=1 Tax=Serinicoccus sp. LYQ131 TaxID=3378797 RepID=UPI0038555B20
MPRATLADLRHAERILVYGVTGSGKSTAARRWGERLGLPVHLVDEEVGWLPGWQLRPVAEQRRLAAELASQDRWILDSAYGSFRDLVLPRAQVVLALDYPRAVSLARLVRRTARRYRTRERVCNGNTEDARQILSRDSILLWHARSFTRKRRLMRRWEADPQGIPVLRVSRPRDLERALTRL